jgi:hypothetical protein
MERLIRRLAVAISGDAFGISRLLNESGENKLDSWRTQASGGVRSILDTGLHRPEFDFPQ